MKKVGTDNKAIISELAKLDYKLGVSNPEISFDENGDLEKGQFEIKIIKNGKSELYSQ